MRDPFSYESNVLLIREIFTPDPIPLTDWNQLVESWQITGGASSLLEYMATRRFSESEIMGVLESFTGSRVISHPEYLKENELDASESVLHRCGYRIIKCRKSRKLVTGGTDMNPDLKQLLGSEAESWEWVLVSPVRESLVPETVQEYGNRSIGSYNLNIWLKDLICGLWSGGVRDIHFERVENELVIRSHKVSEMQTIGRWSDGRVFTVTRLLCEWAGLTSWDHKSIADGSLKLGDGESLPELRLSAVPTVNGESIVLRSHSVSTSALGLQALGLPDELIQSIMDIVLHDPGMIIFSGSTGSGKTTTLYGILHDLQDADMKILTIEDPVERLVSHAVQCAVDEPKGWTFDRAIHSFLRQDPDLIMVGEMRDKLSSEAACRAALTGHSVITSMHAKNEDSAVNRLRSWGIPNGILTESIRLVIHQQWVAGPDGDGFRVKFSWKRFKET